jgi:hypothetical protein
MSHMDNILIDAQEAYERGDKVNPYPVDNPKHKLWNDAWRYVSGDLDNQTEEDVDLSHPTDFLNDR